MYRWRYSQSTDRGTDGRTDRSTDSGTDVGTYRGAARGTTGVQTEVQPEYRQRYRHGAFEITSCKFVQDKTGLMIDHIVHKIIIYFCQIHDITSFFSQIWSSPYYSYVKSY